MSFRFINVANVLLSNSSPSSVCRCTRRTVWTARDRDIPKLSQQLPDRSGICESRLPDHLQKGPDQPEYNLLVLIKVGEHYLAGNSLKRFLDRIFFFLKCEKGFDQDSRKEHQCMGNRCFACHQSGCPDFIVSDGQRVCHTNKKCLECGKTLTRWEISHKHVCGYRECPFCKRYLNLYQRQCENAKLTEALIRLSLI